MGVFLFDPNVAQRIKFHKKIIRDKLQDCVKLLKLLNQQLKIKKILNGRNKSLI